MAVIAAVLLVASLAAPPADPDVVGYRLDEAIRVLQDDGYSVTTEDRNGNRGVWVRSNWIVIDQSLDGTSAVLGIVNERDPGAADVERATTTWPDTPAGQLAAAITRNPLISGDLIDVQVTETGLTVNLRPPSMFVTSLARADVFQVLQTLSETALPDDIESIYVITTGTLTNDLGESAEWPILEAGYSREVLDRLVFENLVEEEILRAADEHLYIHPSIARTDGF